MKTKDYNLLNVGVGGQGVIRAMQILAWSAMENGYQVRTAETHGMAQRGGSVASFLRFGTQVDGPLIPRGRTDVLLAFESSEALRYLDYAGPDTYIIVNERRMIPPTVTDIENYPKIDQIEKALKKVSENVFIVDGTDLAIKAGNPRTLNVVMIGVLYGLNKLNLEKDTLKESILRFVPKKAREVNEIAFDLGINKGKKLEEIIYE
jgi:indolepyruvate ferredoxin oxidoreductase, beta subunit